MKKILVIVTQANLSDLPTNESLSAVMILATFGHQVQVLLKHDALSLLHHHMAFDATKMPFRVASHLVESFEFYDLLPILVEKQQQSSIFVQHCLNDTEHSLSLAFVDVTAEFLNQYDLILTW